MNRLLIPLAFTVAGCATVTADSDQVITVATEPAGAHCTLKNAVGSWEIDATPGSATVARSFSPLTVTCERAGKSGTATLEPGTRNRAYGNILLAGVPALVDAGTGAGYEYDPADVSISLATAK